MVLCGVGGSTIAEAKAALAYDEFRQWIQYRNKVGPFGPADRLEQALAFIAAIFASGMLKRKGGGSWKPSDFLIRAPDEPDQELTPDRAMDLLRGLTNGK